MSTHHLASVTADGVIDNVILCEEDALDHFLSDGFIDVSEISGALMLVRAGRGHVRPSRASEPEPPSRADMEALRQQQFALRCDPIYFKWQRGEATEADWLAEVAAVRAEFPYPDEEA